MTQDGRILLIANNFPPVRGGSATVYANLARCAHGRVIVLAPRINYLDGLPFIGWREHDRHAPYRVVRLPLLRTTSGDWPRAGIGRLRFVIWDLAIRLRVFATLLYLVLTERIRTICIGELLASDWILRLARFIPGLRGIAYVHGEEITTSDSYDRDHRRASSALLLSDAVIVVSRFTQKAAGALLGPVAARRIRLIENGVDTARFRPAPKSEVLLALYGLEGCFVFVSVCRLVEKKGIDNAIRAFAEVVRRLPDSRYLVVGTGPQAEALKALAKAEGVISQVRFTGQVAEEELADHYRLGDVFVMPNRRMPDGDTEGFGLVFLEANGCGLPVIAGRDGGSTDAVRHGVNGLVVDGHSVPAITEAMLALREDPALYASIRRGALDVAAGAGWERRTEAFLEVCLGAPVVSGLRGVGPAA